MKNDGVTRVDDGFFKYKPDLPVRQLMFSDTGHDGEYGYHTLGPLTCFTSK